MRDNYTTVYSYLKNKIDSFQRFRRWNVEIKHLSSIFFFYFFTFYLSRLHVSTGWELFILRQSYFHVIRR